MPISFRPSSFFHHLHFHLMRNPSHLRLHYIATGNHCHPLQINTTSNSSSSPKPKNSAFRFPVSLQSKPPSPSSILLCDSRFNACNHDTISSIGAFAPPPQTPISDLFRHLDYNSPPLPISDSDLHLLSRNYRSLSHRSITWKTRHHRVIFFIPYCRCCSVGVGVGADAAETFSIVLNMQIYIALVATCVCVVGLFASGEWKGLKGEMQGFGKGQISYVMTLVWTAVAWQICSVGVVGLIFVVSSLFSNVISTMALPIVV